MQYESLKRMVFVAAVAAGGCERGGESTVEPGGANQAGQTLVTSDAGQAGAATRLQVLVPWPDLDAAAKPVAGGENDAAVIVALESYAFVPAVPGAMTNGLAWQRYFTKTLQVPVDKVRVLTNTEATKEEIETALDRAAKQAAAGGRVWFVFIGHGAPSRTGQDGLLLGSDVQRTTDSLERRSLRHSDVIARLEQSAAQPVLVLDACFSGQTAGDETLCEGCMPVGLAEFKPPKKAIVLSAAKADQVAGALPGRAQPAFSYLVLGALRGWADGDGNGKLTASEVAAYTNQALGAVVKGRTQTPELLGDGKAVLVTSAGERGPDLAEIQRVLSAGGAVQFNGSGIVLPELPTLTLRDIGRDELEVDLAGIDMKQEKQLEAQYLALENAKAKVAEARAAATGDITGESQAKAWCELAALGDPNPYRKEAEKGCAEVRSYIEQRKRLVVAMHLDWNERVMPFLDLQHRSAEDKRKVVKAFVDAYGPLAEQSPVQAASYWLEKGALPAGMYIRIPGGSFSSNAGTHEIATFELMRTEVTVAMYRACVEAGACKTPLTGSDSKYQWAYNWGQSGRDEHPVNGVSWHDATAYCAWAGGRLPTTWEWEWAARGREEGRRYPWGEEPPRGERVNACGSECVRAFKEKAGMVATAPYMSDDGWAGSAPVGSKPEGASRDGVQDLGGNVWEWTASLDQQHSDERVLHGGGWSSGEAAEYRADYRASRGPDDRGSNFGLRCARNAN